MKRRLAAFTLTWAYTACTIWLPLAAPDTSSGLYFFPPGYFFVVGLLLAILFELLASRLPRLWAIAGIVTISVELGVLLYGGHSPGLSLGLIFAAGALCASLLARYLTHFSALLKLGVLLGGVVVCSWLITPWIFGCAPRSITMSPDGVFQSWSIKSGDGDIETIHVGPRYGFLGAFGRKIAESGTIANANQTTKPESFSWEGAHKLHVKGILPEHLPGPSTLLPIPVDITRIP